MSALLSFLLCLLACGGTKEEPPAPSGDAVRLHTVMEMNQEPPELNSHVGEELSGVLQPMYRYYQVLPHEKLTAGAPDDQSTAIYPRIKRLSDGKYIMFYHGGRLGSRIWCTLSDDFKSWSTPELLYKPYTVNGDIRRFVNPDAVVLPGGDILLVCSYRAGSGYNSGIDCGLSFRRSSDGGKTWSEPWNAEIGPNWEPYLLLLPDGRIQCYYTDATPQTKNSGTSVITSGDGGATWSAKKRVCRLYKYDYRTADPDKLIYNGEKIFTDQMPCFRVLNDGKTIVGWVEDRLEEPAPADCSTDKYSSTYEMSLVYNDGLDWEDLGEDKAGPSRRLNRVVSGAAGYISTFRSGETVLSCGRDGQMHLRMGDASVSNFYGGVNWEKESNWLVPFDGNGYWGATEVVAPVILAAAIHCVEGMQTGLLYLNHRLDASHHAVDADGDLKEWSSDRCFFLGSKSGDELLLRAASDAGNLYLAADCLMADSGKSPSVTILLSKEGGSVTKLIFDKKGLDRSSSSGTACSCRDAEGLGGEKGFAAEISIPLSLLGAGEGDIVRIYALMKKGTERTMFSFSNGSDSSTWQKIKL